MVKQTWFQDVLKSFQKLVTSDLDMTVFKSFRGDTFGGMVERVVDAFSSLFQFPAEFLLRAHLAVQLVRFQMSKTPCWPFVTGCGEDRAGTFRHLRGRELGGARMPPRVLLCPHVPL